MIKISASFYCSAGEKFICVFLEKRFMTYEEAQKLIEEKREMIGIRNRAKDSIHHLVIGPADVDLFEDYWDELRKIKNYKVVSEKLKVTDYAVWAQITESGGVSKFVMLSEFLGTY